MQENLTKPEKDEQTEAGNYFVANYPPFSFWQKDYVSDVLAVLEQPAPPDVPLGIYFHIPFCRKRCHFCYFRVYTDKNAGEIRNYLEAGLREIQNYAAKPYLQGRKPKFIYFGGGTPSYLSVSQLEELTAGMKACFSWDETEEIAFECEPGTLTEKKLDAIRKMGVTRLSLGVENFDDHILESNGRAHRSGEIDRAYGYARKIGFPQINIDLIAGMMNETEENWKSCISQAIALDPDMVTIYQMEVPFNTTMYQRMKDAGKVTAPVADWTTKRRWVSYAFNEFEKAGYSVSSAYTVVKDPSKAKFVYRDSLWSGADLLSFGVASFGQLSGVHYQNQADIDAYIETVHRGEFPIFRAYPTNEEERFIREFVLTFKLGHLQASYYQEKFGIDVLKRFEPQLSYLQSEGFANIEGGSIRLTQDGLLQIDRLLHAFFLKEHQNARYT
ncbi:MAG: coproporphyrinogen III oxidase family protein [Verrucomicrobiae bacterium]|nr:coproporphyrinogen III oxidase family protein [Verrucomicrobiae bacterium]